MTILQEISKIEKYLTWTYIDTMLVVYNVDKHKLHILELHWYAGAWCTMYNVCTYTYTFF